MQTNPPPLVRRASVELFRIYDVAQEIDLEAVERALAGRVPVARIRLTRVQPRAIAFGDPPVVTDLLAPTLEYGGRRVEVQVFATAAELMRHVDLVPVLTQERHTLSEAARRDVLRHTHSYYTDDLVVLTRDRAFILEPSADDDTADVL